MAAEEMERINNKLRKEIKKEEHERERKTKAKMTRA